MRKNARYYQEAQSKFVWNVQKAKKDNITTPIIDSSATMIIRTAYEQGHIFEEIASIIENAPVPKELKGKELKEYLDMVEENALQIRDEALKRYEAGVKIARKLEIDENPRSEIVLTRVCELNPLSPVLFEGQTAWSPTIRLKDNINNTSGDPVDSMHNPLKDSTKDSVQ